MASKELIVATTVFIAAFTPSPPHEGLPQAPRPHAEAATMPEEVTTKEQIEEVARRAGELATSESDLWTTDR